MSRKKSYDISITAFVSADEGTDVYIPAATEVNQHINLVQSSRNYNPSFEDQD